MSQSVNYIIASPTSSQCTNSCFVNPNLYLNVSINSCSANCQRFNAVLMQCSALCTYALNNSMKICSVCQTLTINHSSNFSPNTECVSACVAPFQFMNGSLCVSSCASMFYAQFLNGTKYCTQSCNSYYGQDIINSTMLHCTASCI